MSTANTQPATAVGCGVCGLVMRLPPHTTTARCPRCASLLHDAARQQLQRAWALLTCAVLLYLPANLLPITHTTWFGRVSSDTILGGVITFMQHGDWPIAAVIFLASVVIPVAKMLVLAQVFRSVGRRLPGDRGTRPEASHRLARGFRITEAIGRWSMVDVFVVALLVALLQMGVLVNVQPAAGALAFAGVVICTMLAALSFDRRLLWPR